MLIAFFYERGKQAELFASRFNGETKFNVDQGCIGHYVRKKHEFFFTSSLGCMHTLNTAYLLQHKYGICMFIRLGTCGIINPKLSLGEKLLMGRSLNLDAISEKYIPTKMPEASPLLKSLISCYLGYKIVDACTMDVVWASQPENADVIDMETSALYAYANFFNVQAASISIARDDKVNRIGKARQDDLLFQVTNEVINLLESKL